MAVLLNPYISFRDTTREAMEFYKSVFGGELVVMGFADAGMADDPSDKDKVMHSQLTTPNGMTLMAADTPSSMTYTEGASVSVSLSGGAEDEATLRGYFEALAADGTVTVPLELAPWGDTFGMCVDRFGVQWMVNIAAQAS